MNGKKTFQLLANCEKKEQLITLELKYTNRMKNKLMKLTFGSKYIEYKCEFIFAFLLNKMK